MRLLLIGSTGLLGQALDREAQIRGITILRAARKGVAFAVDIAQADAVEGLIAKAAPDLVINAAAITDVDQCERDPGGSYLVNARAVALLARACGKRQIKLVQVSADHFFTGDGDAKHSEESPVHLLNEYARNKFAAEAFAVTAPGALIVRTNITGIRGWAQPTFFEWVVDSLRHRKPMTLFADYFTSTLDADSLAGAIFDLVDKGAHGMFNVASSEVASKRRFIEALAEAMGINFDWASEGSVRSLSVPRAESLGLDVSRAERVLGYNLPCLTAVIGRLASRTEMAHAV